MRDSQHWISLRSYALAFAVVLSPVFLQTISCRTGNPNLVSVELLVDGVDQIDFTPGQTLYTVAFAADTAILRAQSEDPAATIRYQWWTGSTLIDTWTLGVGSGEVTLDVPEGQNTLRVHVTAPGGAYAYIDIEVDRSPAGSYPCTEQGIRDAIADGGGPHYFDCAGPTIVPTMSEIVINNDVILDGEGNLTVDGQNDHRVFSVYPYTAELRGMTIRGGSGDSGAGIFNRGALTLTDVAVTDCTATGWGGALYQHNGPSMDLMRVTLTGNTAHVGGAIGGGLGPITITDSVLSNNHVSHDGGALTTSTTTTVIRSTLSHNMGLFGGAISVRPDAAVALYDSTVSGNRARTGGGIYTYGALTIDNSVVSDNLVTHGGGGISQSEGTVAISNTTVSGNSAQNGAGIETTAYSPSTSSLTAINTTVSGNSAQYGGGIYAGGAASVALAHVTASGNTAGHEGSAGYGTDTVTVTYKNNLIEGTCAAGSTTGTVISYGYNIESPGNTCGLTHPTDVTGVTPGNLGLGLLQDNGGPALTHAPLSTASVAYNAVPAAACTDHGGAPLFVDQRGFVRPENLDCDAGAVEGTCPDCSDGVLCSQDKCDPVLQACSNPSVVCPSDDIECTGDVCDPATGLCNVTDGTLCELGIGQCLSGVCDLCAGVTCPDDGNDCTVDVCDWATGACYEVLPDGYSCAGGAGQCVDGVCDLCVSVMCPDDGNECTDDVCDPATGECYVPLPDGSLCESGNGECSEGLCRGPEWLAIYRGGSIYQAVAMNPRGDGMAVWNETGFYLGDPDRLAARAYNVNDGWEQGWFDAFRVDNVEANVHGGVDVAMDEDGYAIAVWQQWLAGTGQAVYASRYTPGVGWDTQVPISSGGGDRQRYDLQVKVDSAGRALAVWVERETDNQTYVLYELWANHFSPLPTPTWGTPEIIDTQTGGNALSADLGMDWTGTQSDGTTGVVVWLEQASGGGNYIWARHYRGGWEVTPVQLGEAYSVDVRPQVEMDVTGDAIAVWRQTANEIWTNRATSASGTAWGQPEFLVNVDLPPSVHDPLTLAMAPFARPPIDNQQEAIFAWPQVNGADFDLWTMRYTPGSGSGWGPAELIETHDGEVTSVDVAMDGQGNASAVWVRTPSDGSDPQVWINRYDKFPYPNLSLDGWRTAERLERFTRFASNPHVAMDSNRDGVVVFDAAAGPYGQSTRWTFAGAPTLSNPRVTHVPSSVWCLPNNYFRFQADYWDPDGDVVGTSAVRVFVDVLYDNHVENLGGFPSDIYESEPVYNQLSGSGFSGTITANNCRYFGAAEWADVSLTIRDAAGNESHNTVTMRVDKPAGAN